MFGSCTGRTSLRAFADGPTELCSSGIFCRLIFCLSSLSLDVRETRTAGWDGYKPRQSVWGFVTLVVTVRACRRSVAPVAMLPETCGEVRVSERLEGEGETVDWIETNSHGVRVCLPFLVCNMWTVRCLAVSAKVRYGSWWRASQGNVAGRCRRMI